MDERIDERTLREIYLKPFQMTLQADHWTVVTSYPKINGEHADTSPFLVRNILRQVWRYDGLVLSDWGGLNDTVKSIAATTDLEMPGRPMWHGPALVAAVRAGRVSEREHIDPSVRRLLRLLKRAGLISDPQAAPTSLLSASFEDRADTPEFRQLARDVAASGIVLLKNSRILPLQPGNLRSIAIIGPNAVQPTTGGT
jgi:beta-glucosidase